MRYTKKPVTIEALNYDGSEESFQRIVEWAEPHSPDHSAFLPWEGPDNGMLIETLEGVMNASPGDFIIKGVDGEFYPCKPSIFWRTYDPAAE